MPSALAALGLMTVANLWVARRDVLGMYARMFLATVFVVTKGASRHHGKFRPNSAIGRLSAAGVKQPEALVLLTPPSGAGVAGRLG